MKVIEWKNKNVAWNPENYKCLYCGGNCPKDEDHACDGYSGDIDNLYNSREEDEKV